jgi:hypothetical protein
MTGAANHAALSSAQPEVAAKSAGNGFNLFGADGFTFKDLLDVINPLQQLPIVGTIYRHLTGDHISPFSRVVGGFLVGGPIGAAVSAVNAVVEESSGKDLGEQVVSAFEGHPTADGAAAQVADAETVPAGVAATPRPGGWMINAAYGNRNPVSAARMVAMQAAIDTTSERPAYRPRPGGWMVNAAYGNFDAVGRHVVTATGARQVDVSA